MKNMEDSTFQFDRSLGIPHLENWLGYWLMEPQRGANLLKFVQSLNLSAHIQQVNIRQSAEDEDEQTPKKPTATTERWSAALSATNREIVTVANGYSYEIIDGVALTELTGKLMKHRASGGGTSTVMMRSTVRNMTRDDRVKAVLIAIDSPGGTVAGAYDLAADIATLSAKKPTHAYIEDLGASAAYLQASQTRSISANSNAEVGSIGTVGVVYDESAAAAMQGIKVHVLRGRIDGKPAPHKGAGAPGSEITADHLERWQEEIDDLNEQFIQAVSRGRRMTRQAVEAVADGGIWVGAKAKERGLVDRVESLDAMFARIRGEVNSTTKQRATASADAGAATEQQTTAEAAAAGESGASAPDAATGAEATTGKETAMSQSNPAAPGAQTPNAAQEPKPASIAELKAAFPKDPAFALEAAEKALTLTEAKAAYADVLQSKLAEKDQTIQQLQTQQTQAPAGGKRAGTKPIESAASEQAPSHNGGDPIEAFNEAVVQQMARPGYQNDRKKAIAAVMKAQPELHQAYLLATNTGATQQGLIKQRFSGM
jgi:signal peptide peptidase SppA